MQRASFAFGASTKTLSAPTSMEPTMSWKQRGMRACSGSSGFSGDLGNKGVKGAHDWFFYRPDVEYLVRPDVFDARARTVDANDVALTDDIVGGIVDFKEQLAARGIDLLLVAMPGKPSIYPDLLNPSVRPESAGTISHTNGVLERLQKAGIETVDLFAAFARERGNDAACGDSLYLHTDTHFKGRGVLAAARTVADRVRRYPWYEQGRTEFASDTDGSRFYCVR